MAPFRTRSSYSGSTAVISQRYDKRGLNRNEFRKAFSIPSPRTKLAPFTALGLQKLFETRRFRGDHAFI